MDLPDITTMSVSDFLALDVIEIMRESRDGTGRDEFTPDERLWLAGVHFIGLRIADALGSVTTLELLDRLERRAPRRGRPRNLDYLWAFIEVYVSHRKRMEVYRTDVLPRLIERGEIALTPEGDPDPTQEFAAREAYTAALDRMRRKLKRPRK